MSSADTVAQIFDQAKNYTLNLADELSDALARNESLEGLLKRAEEERDREQRDRLHLLKQYEELELRARKLERDNAVMHSRGDLIVDIWKGDGERIAESSDLRPEQILQPRSMPDDQLEREFAEIGKKLQAQRDRFPEDRGYIAEHDRSVSQTAERSGLAEAAANSSETVKENHR